jgi:iron complex outermembrane recepter protein
MRFSNRLTWLAFALAMAVGTADIAAQSTATLMGRVTDESGAALSGAQVVITNQATGLQTGGLTQADGRYAVPGIRAGGPYLVDIRMIGYGRQAVEGVMLAAGESKTLDFRLGQEAISLDALEVFATRAIERKTPVAFSNVSKVQIQNQLGSRDLPLVLNVTPSVYATAQGGGAGDARINVRGFNQRNTAVMINGVPVNDMENGWVYWSNWDGLGDASTSIQLQRGLSAVNLATPSIGGTLNVITDPSAQAGGFSYKQEFGLGNIETNGDWGAGRNLSKETFTVNTGEHNGFAVTASAVRKTGDGMYRGFFGGDATWTDAWSYYLATSYQLNARNRLELYAVGAPQRHGQNLYKLNIGTLDQAFARGLDDYDPAAFSKFSEEAGRRGSPNVNPVSCSYTGQQYSSTGPDGGKARARHDCSFINERENYFHKPQVNLNWYSYFGNGLTLTTVGYYSGGNGGGTGTYGSSRNASFRYDFTQRVPDWDGTIAKNRARADGSAGYILRNSVNNQWTIGAISKLRKDFSSGWTGEFGVDWRTASIDHYREVRDLLGGSYYDDCGRGCSSAFWTGNEGQRKLGDKINYNNTNQVDWLGMYVQGEKTSPDGSLYGMFGWSQNAYTFDDHFKADDAGNPRHIESGNIRGYQLKGGAVRNLTQEWSVFGNAGYVSKVPIFDGVIDDNAGVINPNPKNEKFLSFESGIQFRSADRGVSFDMNFYYTKWTDRTRNLFVRNLEGDGRDGLVNLLGVNARHMGVELQAAVQPSNFIRFDAAASLGNWKYLDNVTGTYKPDDKQSETQTFDFFIRDLKVADAPQSQLALSASVFPVEGLYISLVSKTFGNYYAQFDPFSRTDAAEEGVQSWKAPGYTVFDMNASYRITDILPVWKGGDVRLFVNVYNLFDKTYVQDAVDNSRFNAFDKDHDSDSAEVFLGYPRNVNIGFQINF